MAKREGSCNLNFTMHLRVNNIFVEKTWGWWAACDFICVSIDVTQFIFVCDYFFIDNVAADREDLMETLSIWLNHEDYNTGKGH